MTILELKKALEANRRVILDLFDGVGDDEMRFKPAADRWSLLEVINHLADEEREDFRTCLSNMMRDPTIDWPDIRPLEWVESREYGKRNPSESIERFGAEREKSLVWLEKVPEPDLSVIHAGKRGFDADIHIGDVVASWVAHDYFHIRQSTNLMWEYLMATSQPYSCQYAGGY